MINIKNTALLIALLIALASINTVVAESDGIDDRYISLEETKGKGFGNSYGWYPEHGNVPIVSDLWGNGDLFSFPAEYARGDFQDHAFFIRYPQPIARAKAFNQNEVEIIELDGKLVTKWALERKSASELGFRIGWNLWRKPEKITFTVVNDSDAPIMLQPNFIETRTARKWAYTPWHVGSSIIVEPASSKNISIPFNEFEALVPERLKKRKYDQPVFPGVFGCQVMGLRPGKNYELILSDYVVHYGYAKGFELESIDAPSVITANEPANVELSGKLTAALKPESLIDLEIRKDGRTMWRYRLNDRQSEILITSHSEVINISLPDFLVAGDYTLGMAINGYRVKGPVANVVLMNQRVGNLPQVNIEANKGRQSIQIDGEFYPWIGHASINLAPADIKTFAQADADFIIETAAGVSTVMSDEPTWDGRGDVDFSSLDQRVAMVLAEAPNALLVIRPNMALPTYWKQNNADERSVAKHTDGTTADTEVHDIPLSSFASEAWQQKQEEVLRQLVNHIKEQPWADNVIAFWLCSRPHEWFFAGSQKEFWDYGIRSQESFNDWLEESTLKANLEDEIEYGNVIPAPLERLGQKKQDFHLPNDEGILTAAYNLHEDELTREVIERFAQAVKEETDDHSIVGVHYGYVFVFGDTFHQGRSCMLSSYDELIENPDVDFVAGVIVPKNWGLNSHDFYSLPFEALGLRGKHYMLSNDLAFYHTPYPYEPFDPDNLDASDRFMQQRILANAAIHGVSPHWFGLRPSWWGNESAQRTITEMIDVYKKAYEYDVSSEDEVALVVDVDSYPWLQDRSRFARNNTYLLYRALQRTGAPLGTWTLDDVDQLPDSIKFVVVSFAAGATQESLDKLSELIQQGGRTIVVIGRPGYIDTQTGMRRPDQPADLLGFPIRMIEDEQEVGLLPTGEFAEIFTAFPEHRYDSADVWVGLGLPEVGYLSSPELAMYPRAVVDAPSLIEYDNGEGAFAERSLANNGRLIWMSTAPISSSLWRHMLEPAGVHFYAPLNFFVHSSKDLTSVTAPSGQEVEIEFREPVAVVDLFDPQFKAEGLIINVPFEAGQTRLLKKEPKK